MVAVANSIDTYKEALRKVLRAWENFPSEQADFRIEAIIDQEKDRYLLQDIGWENGKRLYSTLAHVDIINGKFWIQQDNTETGIANELVAAGVPKDRIVLAFYPKTMREWGEFAVE